MEKEQNIVLVGGQPTFGTCAFLCAPDLTCAAVTVIIVYVSCQQSTYREVAHKGGGCY